MATKTARVAMAATAINALALRNVGLVDGRVASLFYCLESNAIPRLSSMAGWWGYAQKVRVGQNDPLRPSGETNEP